jgi:hypothetical protein
LGEKVYRTTAFSSPTRSEYVDLVDDVAAAFLPSLKEGARSWNWVPGPVLAAVLAREAPYE